MNSDIINLLKETAANFAELAAAFEEEQKTTNARLDFIERTSCETKQTLKEVADLILSRL